MPRWKQAQIVEIKDLTSQLRLIKLHCQTDEPETYRAGQFITFDLPVGEKRLDRWRSYSIANAPNNDNIIELCIVRVPEGRATTYLFEEIKVGMELKYKGPLGAFVLPEEIEHDIVMICTGTGVAPFRSMLWDIAQQAQRHRRIDLVYGTRHSDSLLYIDEFKALEKELDGFHYHVALSRESYAGYQGYVHDLYERIEHEDLTKVKYYLCGWQQMIDEAVERLTQKMKIDRSDIVYELYG